MEARVSCRRDRVGAVRGDESASVRNVRNVKIEWFSLVLCWKAYHRSLPNLGSLFVSAQNSLFVIDFDVSMSLLLVPVESTFAFVKPVIMEIDICAIATLTGKAINRKVKYRCKGRDPGQRRVSELAIIMCCLNWLSLHAITPGLRTQYLTGKTITKVESANTIDIVEAKF